MYVVGYNQVRYKQVFLYYRRVCNTFGLVFVNTSNCKHMHTTHCLPYLSFLSTEVVTFCIDPSLNRHAPD